VHRGFALHAQFRLGSGKRAPELDHFAFATAALDERRAHGHQHAAGADEQADEKRDDDH
jgi:hypothetical protein